MQHKIQKVKPRHRFNQHSFAHKMVRDLQIEMAHEVYDALARKDDKFWRENDETEFVNAIAPSLRDEARALLTDMLTQVGTTEQEKNDIYTALILDAEIPNEDRWVMH